MVTDSNTSPFGRSDQPQSQVALNAALDSARGGKRLDSAELALLINVALDGPAEIQSMATEALVGLVGSKLYNRKPRSNIQEAERLLGCATAPRLRAVGAFLLQHEPSAAQREKLVEHLADPDEEVQEQCAKALRNLGGVPAEEVAHLLRAELPETRLLALDLIRWRDEGLRSTIRISLSDTNSTVRQAAARLLADSGDLSAEVVAVLLESAKNSPDAAIRLQAVEHLANKTHQSEVRDVLIEVLLGDSDNSVRIQAATVLGRVVTTDERAAEAELSVLLTAPCDVALAAAEALAHRGVETERRVPELLKLFESEHLAEATRGQIGVVLATFGRVEILPELVRIATAPDSAFKEPGVDSITGIPLETPAIKLHAVRAIGVLGHPAASAAGALLPFLEAGTEVQEAAAEALLQIGASGDAVENALATATSRVNPRVGAVVLRALASTGVHLDISLEAILRALTPDRPEEGRGLAMEARTHLCVLANRMGAPLIERIRGFVLSGAPRTRAGALEGLLVLGVPTKESLDRLVERIGGSSADERAETVGELRMLGTRAVEATTGVQHLLRSTEPPVRAAALSVSAAVGGSEPWVLAALGAGLRDDDALVRESACGALCDLPALSAELGQLTAGLQADPEPRVRDAAARVHNVFLATPEGALAGIPATSDKNAAVGASGRFLFRLCRALPENGRNLVLSSYSVFSLLSVLLRATEGQSRRELMNALGWRGEPSQLLKALGDLSLEVSSVKTSHGFSVVNASGLWTQVGYPIREEFLRDVSSGPGLFQAQLDFAAGSEQACSAINGWISEMTAEQIGPLISDISTETRFVLANAIYFKSRWERPFTDQTQDAPFRRLDGRELLVPMMMKQGGFRYVTSEGLDFELIEIPYQTDAASMLVVLPRSGFFGRVERLLDYDTLERAIGLLEDSSHSNLKLPRFTVAARLLLADQVAQLGAPSVLTATADLSGLTPLREPWEGKILHEAKITVDEKGTEAAAATVIYHIGGIPNEVVVERPFLFFIRHRATGVILFSGRVIDPSAQ